MRILRNIILLIFPLVIFVNLYQYIVITGGTNMGTFEYKGFHYFFEYFNTFNGLNHFMDTISEMSQNVNSFVQSTTEITDLISFFVAFGEFFKMVYVVLKLPIMIVVDIISDIIWFIQMFMIF